MQSKIINFANDVWPFVIFRPLINVRKCREVIYISQFVPIILVVSIGKEYKKIIIFVIQKN